MLTLSVSEKTSTTESLSFKDSNYLKLGNGKVIDDEDNLCISEKVFILPNGDLYSGSLIDNLPEGSGKYIWSDGVKYEGQWKCGVRSGYGKLQRPSGAIYEGDFLGGYMHGTGTYTCSDMTYKGRWRLNLKHGLGYQVYSNGDILEGAWMQGTPEGSSKYTWSNQNVYLGNMKAGKMTGKGTLIWTNGESFEGGWLDGMMHGFGVYTWSDGSCYIGIWTKGLKDGKGTFYPKGDRLPEGQKLYLNSLRKRGLLPDLRKQNQISHINHTSSVGVNQGSGQHSSDKLSKGNQMNLEQSGTINVSLERHYSLDVSIEKAIGDDFSLGLSEALGGAGEQDVTDSPILEREYMQGVLISEVVISNRFSPSSKGERKKKKKLAKGIKRIGEIIIKGHRSYDLMLSLQLGIRYTVGKITPIKRRDVRASDFGSHASFWMNFPKQGSQLTPPHQSEDFWWKEYCPMVFRNLREMFKIDAADYMISICGNDALRELSSPGKSGSIFFLSQDDRFMIKTLRKSEVKVLLQMLPAYHHHVQKYENTLITKFFGLHRIEPLSGRKFQFVVMGNMFCTELRIHRRFDLKGSSLGRSANKVEIDENTILKDLDLNYRFYLESTWRAALLKQIETDSKFLESLNIMDYSMLLGVHYRAPQRLRSHKSHNQRMTADRLEVVAEEESMDDEIYAQGLILVPHGSDDNIVSVGPHIRGSRLRASSTTGNEEVDLLLPGTARLQIQLGVNMPARAEQMQQHQQEGKDENKVFDVVLYLGIIDILQEYNMRKKIEHAYKSIHFDSFSISAVDPTYYSRRILHFIDKVFPSNLYAS